MEKLFKHKGDKTIWGVFFILALSSIVLVYSASSYIAVTQHDGNNWYYLFKQTGFVFLGYIVMLAISRMRYNAFNLLSPLAFYFIALPLLVYTAFFGVNINNASRWITIPVIGISFQASDFAKIVLLAYLARTLSKLPGKPDNKQLQYTAWAIFLPIFLVTAFILRSNLSTSLLVFFTAFFVMWLGEVKIKYLSSLVGIGFLTVVLALLITKSNPNFFPRLDTWVSRIENFKSDANSDANYQVTQAKIAIASNPLFGSLPGKSSQRAFLPSAHADFIYAIIIEEYGTIIGFIFIILYMILLWRAIQIARKSETRFGAILAMGLMFSIVFQAMVNMGVATNLLPVTGQTLPLVSMGGTSFVFTSMALGMIQSVANGLNKPKEKNTKEKQHQ
ncbi:MAG: FtsW/RodA/SpoVE family cell cycle protein [Bacteroidales bacterium]|nr:FtsW/RodA/SpoVE family cell cycle protein [Bacteroidales bacterium]